MVKIGWTSGNTDWFPKDMSVVDVSLDDDDETTFIGKQRRWRFDDGVLDSYGVGLVLESRSCSNERFNVIHEAIKTFSFFSLLIQKMNEWKTKTNTQSKNICKIFVITLVRLVSNEREVNWTGKKTLSKGPEFQTLPVGIINQWWTTNNRWR